MSSEFSQGILQINQLRKQGEDWKKKAIGRWKEGQLSLMCFRHALASQKPRPDLLRTKVGGCQQSLTPSPSQECPLPTASSTFCSLLRYLLLLLHAQSSALGLTSNTTAFAVPPGNQPVPWGSEAFRGRGGKLFSEKVKEQIFQAMKVLWSLWQLFKSALAAGRQPKI